VGEIRDEETASIALRAAQTGHLVLATIHCETSASAIVRLLDLGVSPILMSTGLSVIISQRLVRRLCDKCKVPAKLGSAQVEMLRRKKLDHRKICEAKGCPDCRQYGYLGRVGVCDIMVFDDRMKTQIAKNDLLMTELKDQGDEQAKAKLRKRAFRLVLGGVTSSKEIKRVFG
jgi:type II secretory ATPase GspE/PulE/Tfp pilus assembly ATPase PilB-like protein